MPTLPVVGLTVLLAFALWALCGWASRSRRAHALELEQRRERFRLANELPHRPYTLEDLRRYDGSSDERPIALAAKGQGAPLHVVPCVRVWHGCTST